MSRAPFFKLFFSDLVGDTLHLSDAEMGSYFLLLGAMWNAGGPLAHDHKRLARMARCTPRNWPDRWAVIGPYFTVTDEEIGSDRLLKERKNVTRESELKRQLGERGNEAKRRKRQASANANANAPANAAIAKEISLSPKEGRETYLPQPSGRLRDEIALPSGCEDGTLLDDPTVVIPFPEKQATQ